MHKKLFALFLMIFLIFPCISFSNPSKLFSIEIYQNGQKIIPVDDLYQLKPLPFDIQFSMPLGKEVFINFSEKDKLYKAARNKQDFTNILGFGGTGMAEGINGEDTYIFLTESGWHVWYYEGEDDKRFTNITKKDNMIIAERKIDEIYINEDVPKPINEITKLKLFVVYCDVADVGDYEYKLIDNDFMRINISK
jgi:hypothetical protein